MEMCYPDCPFRGCAGDWVKLGVAKVHGAVLGDAVSKMADENTKVQLVERDIPGAKLPKPAEFCTVATMAVLQRCRSVRKSEGFDQKVRLRALQCTLFQSYCDICN